jgi:predicted Zn-dependent peptidase
VRLEEYRSVTAADLKRVAARVLAKDARTIVRVLRGRA